MNEPLVRFPVLCPTCGSEYLIAYPVADIASALIERRGLRLYAQCHEFQKWTASELELEQIREYLGAAWIDDVDRKAMADEGPMSSAMASEVTR